jgi:hypothetical protein
MRYIYTGDKSDGTAAEFFWDAVALHHSYATGGHGRDEYFGPPDELSERVDGRTNESCNVYNMLKMTRRLFSIRPDIKYAEFEERALFNHVLGSIDPEDGRTCYMVPVGRGVKHEYQDMSQSFTCCVGSGMESHGLHGDGIYYEAGDRLWVNLYVSSTAEWKEAGVKLAMETSFPEGESATLKLTLQKPKAFALILRRPSWAEAGFEIKLNGKAIKGGPQPGSYFELKRSWKTGDTVAFVLPKTPRLEGLADNKNRAALMWGPLVLAGDLGPERDRRSGPGEPVPSFVTGERPVAAWLKPIEGMPGSFRSAGVGRANDGADKEMDFVPFYRLHRRTYSLYWDLYTPEAWSKRIEEIKAEAAAQRKLEAATIVFIQPGDANTEKNFNQLGEDTTADRSMGRPSRRGKKWFSFDLAIDSSNPVVLPIVLIATYHNEERSKRTFDILVDGQKVGEQTIERSPPGSAVGSFFDVEYKIPVELVKEKKKLTVRFQATGTNEIAAVYGIRMIRADPER